MSDITPPPPPPPAPPPPPPPPPNQPSGGNVGNGISWALSAFGKNAGPFIGFAAVVLVVTLIGRLITQAISSALTTTDANCSALMDQQQINDCLARNAGGLVGGTFFGLFLNVIVFVLVLLAEIGLINSALKVTRGEKAQFSNMWHPQHGWLFLFVGLAYGVVVSLGFIACIIPGLLLMWIWQFCRYAALDRGKGFGDAFGTSVRLVMANKGEAVLTMLVTFVASLISVVTCGIGALLVDPFMALFMAYMYRRFNGEEVTPAS